MAIYQRQGKYDLFVGCYVPTHGGYRVRDRTRLADSRQPCKFICKFVSDVPISICRASDPDSQCGVSINRISEEITQYQVNSSTNKRIALQREEKRRTNRERTVNEPPPNQEPRTINHKPITKDKPNARNAQLSETFQPTDEHFELASKVGINLHDEIIKFADYHKARGSVMKDWNAALRTWIRNAATFAKKNTPSQTRADQNKAAADLLTGRSKPNATRPLLD